MKSNTNYKLSASIICGNMLDLQSDIKSLEEGGIDYIHFDVMDGNFVPRLGLHPEMLKMIKSVTSIPVDVHLMIDNPESYIEDFSNAGADIIVIHAEATKHLHRTVKKIKKYGVLAGIALNPSTPLNVLDYILDDIDLVLLMAINPGIVGHKLIPQALNKIQDLRKKLSNHPNIIVQIDGGVTPESAPEMISRGANLLVCGTSIIFNKGVPVGKKVKEARQEIDRELNKLKK